MMPHHQSSTRIKRKPPPAFPYSPRYPEPDPTDPFATLSALRARAHSSSTTALDALANDSYRPGTADSRRTHYLYPDSQDVSRLTDEPRTPWHGFTRPFRPPKSRKRPLVLSSYAEADRSQQVQPLQVIPQATSTPRQRESSAARRDSQYHYRRRSQSLFDFGEARHTNTVRPPTRANTSEAQFAYDVRQSHGYVLGEVDHLDFMDDDRHPAHEEPVKSASTFHSRASTHSTRTHTTPPMTPDDSLSEISMSPRHERSFSPPLLLEEPPAETKVEILPVVDDDDDDPVSASNRNTIVADTPVTGAEFSILLPPPVPKLSVPIIVRPPSAPPSPVRDEPMAPPASSRRQVESDSEAVVADSLRRRSIHGTLKRFRRPPSVVTSGIRNKPISSPSPVATHPPPRAEAGTAPVAAAALRAIGVAPLAPSTNASANPSMENGNTMSFLDVPGPKPKKSLSYMSLGLKPLPNMSLAPTVASANTSIASELPPPFSAPASTSVFAPPPAKPTGGLTRSRPERAQTAPAPVVPPSEPVRQEVRRAQTDHRVYSTVLETPENDAYTHDAGYRKVASHRDTILPPPPPRAKSPDRVVEQDRRTAMPPRRPSDHSTRATSPIPPIPAPIPAPKPVLAAAKPLAAATSKPIDIPAPVPAREVDHRLPTPEPKDDLPPTCYRKPEPLPLSPPPRAKSPMATHVVSHIHDAPPVTTHRQEVTPPPAPKAAPATRARSPTPERPRMRRRDDTDRSSETHSHRSDEGYLPVAQLRPGPSVRQSVARPSMVRNNTKTTTQSQPLLQVKKAKPPPKDLDSPLPPPPSEPQQDVSMVTPSMVVASPPPVASIPSVSPPRRQRTAPPTPMLTMDSPAITTRSHDAYHTRSCSGHAHHWTHETYTPTGEAYPPMHDAPFDEHAIPTPEQIARAADIPVVAQNGVRKPFGDIFAQRKVVVIFVRHFWCPLCQDYMYSVSRYVDPAALRRANVELVVIGLGSERMIKSYRQIFRMPFEMFTDPSARVHRALGMTRRTSDGGPDHQRGRYIRHGRIGGLAMVVRNALRVGMPVWERGGDSLQLGGEFVLGPGLQCTYAHRMPNTRAHAPILDVLRAASVPLSTAQRAEFAYRERSRRANTGGECTDEYCGVGDDYVPSASSSEDDASRSAPSRRTTASASVLATPRPANTATRSRNGHHHLTKALPAPHTPTLKAKTKPKQQRAYKYTVANPDRPARPGRSESTEKYPETRRRSPREGEERRREEDVEEGEEDAEVAEVGLEPLGYVREKGSLRRRERERERERERREKERDEAYMLTHDAVAYAYHHNIV